MKKTILSLLAGGLFAFAAQAQTTPAWAYAIGGTSSDYPNQSIVDDAGNLYITGEFQGTAAFDEAGTTTLTSAGDYDVFVAKYSPSGALLWAKRIGNTGYDAARSLAFAGSGNLYVAGTFAGTVDFDPNAGTQNATASGAADAFLLKLDSNGAFVSLKQFSGAGYDQLFAVSVDGSGSACLGLYFENSIDSDPNAGTQTLTNSGVGSALIKLDAAGNFVWSHAMETSDASFAIATNAAGDVYFAQGYYGLTLDLDRSAATQAPASSLYGSGVWLAKWNSAGTFQWTKTLSAKSHLFTPNLQLLGNGNVVLTGAFRDTMDMDPGAATVLKTNALNANADVGYGVVLDAAGNYVSGHTFEPQNTMGGSGVYAVSRDADDNIYLAGAYTGNVDFDPSAATAIDTSSVTMFPTPRMPFIVKLSSAGAYLWHYAITDSLPQTQPASVVSSLNAEHLYFVGSQYSAVPFPTDTTTAFGGADIFIAKWTQTPILISVERTTFAQMQLFPNPSFDGRVTIQLGEMSAQVQATVVNALGQVVSSTQHQNVEQLQVELPAAAGIYFIELRGADGKTATLKAQRN